MSNIIADWEFAIAALNPDPGATRLLDRRDKKDAQLRRFKEKQKRQLRWVPLRSVINWLKEFNEHGERCAPNERLAEMRADEIWGALTGSDILFAKYQLGNNGFADCLIEDDANPKAVSRFTADDMAGASKDPQMISALIDRLWVPRELLLDLFQKKKWHAGTLFDPPPVIATAQHIAKPAPTIEDVYLAWIDENKFQKKTTSRGDDLVHMRKTFPDVTDAEVRSVRRRLAPAEWKEFRPA